MTFNNSPYDAIGVAIVGELFKQAEEISPIGDEPTPKQPSLLKRFVRSLRNNDQVVNENGYPLQNDDCASPKPI